MNLKKFNNLLFKIEEGGIDHFVQKHVIHGTPYVFHGREDEYFEFRARIAKQFGVGFNDVFIVGSGKLGFSFIKNTEFGLNSDIDVVILSSALFDEFCERVSDFEYDRSAKKVLLDASEEREYWRFLRWIPRGWIRPDLVPKIFAENNPDDWGEYFKSISYGNSEVGNYKVSAGVFKSYDYLLKYHRKSVYDQYRKLKVEDAR